MFCQLCDLIFVSSLLGRRKGVVDPETDKHCLVRHGSHFRLLHDFQARGIHFVLTERTTLHA